MTERYFYTEGDFGSIDIMERTGIHGVVKIARVGVNTKYRKTGRRVSAGVFDGGGRDELESYKVTDAVTSDELAEVVCEYLEEKHQRAISQKGA